MVMVMVMVILNTDEKLDKSKFKRKITKRSMKNFSEESWNQCLANKDWSKIDECTDVNEMVSIFTEKINEALDEVAPIKTFTIKSNYKFGLSENTKKLMQERDCTRKQINQAKKQEKAILQQKYKKLRNNVTSQIRKDNIDHNNNRVNEANSEV